MKTNLIRFFTAISFCAVLFSSCGKKKEVAEKKIEGEMLITEYCSSDQYKSDAERFRATATGESMDRETAKKKARSNASSELAKTIMSTMQIVGDNFVKSAEFNNKEQVTENFQEMARTVVDQKMKGVIEICEKLTQKADGNYVSYIAIELTGKDVLTAMDAKLSQDELIKVDYDYEKFKAEFEKEMNKRAGGQ